MKISDIKNLKELEVISENWYQRTRKLSHVIHDVNSTPLQKVKAFILCKIMAKRLLNIALVIKTTRVQNIPKFERGSDDKDNPLTRKNSGLNCPNNFSL